MGLCARKDVWTLARHMNVIPHAGPVGRGKPGAEDRDAVAQPGRRFACGIHQARTAPAQRARAQRRIGAGDIEQTQRYVPEFMSVRRVAQRRFRRRLGNAVGRERRERRILIHRHRPRRPVHRRRRRKHHVAQAAIDRRTDQLRRRHAVDAMMLPRLRERLGNPHASGQMHDRADRVLLQGRSQRPPIADIGPNEGDIARHGVAPAAGEIVDDRHPIAALAEGEHDVAPDIAGAARDENGLPRSQASHDSSPAITGDAAPACRTRLPVPDRIPRGPPTPPTRPAAPWRTWKSCRDLNRGS